ncbi:hypothetical protein [Actinomadura fibrosa]|uniref:YggT family protein n=1 Tax=Actinomadura fibrosa TaxID=111802 RepID=A0ABW2Y3D8_9ACTN|nr:hypothetical protein [Actinomadura fibrosa]
MADHPDQDPAGGTRPATRTGTTGTRTGEPVGEHRAPRARPAVTAAAVRRRAATVIAAVISAVTTVVVVILAVHIIFVTFEANTSNDLVRWFGDRATDLAWQFKDVFQPKNPKAEVAVNYGLAALVYLVVGRILVTVVRRLGG